MKAPKPKKAMTLQDWKEVCGGIGKPIKIEILAEPTAGKFGWEFPIKVGKEERTVSIKDSSANYGRLFESLGDDFADWVGSKPQAEVIVLEEGQYEGKEALVLSI